MLGMILACVWVCVCVYIALPAQQLAYSKVTGCHVSSEEESDHR